jgi:hypothetical protein
MRIAVLTPWENTAETQCIAWMRLAAARRGHDLHACRTSDALAAWAPDFALVFSPSLPKLTDVPTYGLILDFRDHWLSEPARLANLYTYDGYLALSDRLHRFVRDALDAAGRDEPVGRFYPSALDPGAPPLPETAFERPRLAYFGINWEERRRGMFARLARRPWMELYGPAPAWAFLDTPAYKGAVPFDAYSVVERYRAAGIGLVVLSDPHLADDCTTNRIFEICAAGALAIVPRMPWYERAFGDSVLYFRQQRGDNIAADEIAAHVEWAAAHPREAAAMAARAHEIFVRELSLDRLFDNVLAYHAEREAARRAAPVVPPARVSVVVRARDGDAKVLRRCLRSVAAQAGVEVDVVLVPYGSVDPGGLVDELRHEGFSLTIVEPGGRHRSTRLLAALKRCAGDFVAVLDDRDEWLSGHLRSLVDAAARGDGFAYSGSLRHHEQPRRTPVGLTEHRSVESFSFGVLPDDPLHRAATLPIGAVLWSRRLLDEWDLVDPETDAAEDEHVLLSLLAKGNPAFTFRATAVCRGPREGPESPDGSARGDDLHRLTRRFRGRPFPPPPSAIDPGRLRRDPAPAAAPDVTGATSERTSEYGMPLEHVFAASGSWRVVPVALTAAQIGVSGETRSELPDAALPLRVRPPRQAWAYGALLALPYADAGPCVVRLRGRVLSGRAGFGVLTSDESDFIERLLVPAQPGDVVVDLSVPFAEKAGRVVVQATDTTEVVEVLLESVDLVC